MDCIHFHFNQQIGIFSAGRPDRSGKVTAFARPVRQMIVFNQHTVKQAVAVVGSAAADDRVFFKRSKCRCGFARIENKNFRIIGFLDIAAGHRGNSGHPLNKIQRGAFSHQDRTGRA